MPVKNVKRKTNDGFEGVITGLNDKEKEIIANSVGIEANPTDEATETLTKLKVGNTTYDFNRTLVKNGTYVSEEGFATLNDFSFTAEEIEKINNGEIDMLIGEFNKQAETYYYNAKRYYLADDDMPLFICSSYTLMNGESIHYDEVQIYPSLGQGGMISADSPFIPKLPSDASTKKYTLKAVNGTLTWVDLATDSETFNNITVNGNAGVQGNLTTVGKVLSQGGLEVYGNSVFTKNLSTSATLTGAHVVSGNTELLPITPNPTDEATETLEKVKIGDVAYNVGGGGGITKRTLTIPKSELSLGGDLTEDGKHKALVLSETARANFVSFIEGSSIEECALVKVIVKTSDEISAGVPFNIALNLNKSITDYGLSYMGANVDFITLSLNAFYLFVNDTFDKNIAYFQNSQSYFDAFFSIITELEIIEYII